jgi:8-oxo-dGTP pyrophosphatase MutT (NUDIX family)
MDKKLSRNLSWRTVESGTVNAVGVWFRSNQTGRYLYLLRNDPKHPGTWGLPGGKVESGETLLEGMQRECLEELGCFPVYQRLIPIEKFTSADEEFSYHTFVCVIDHEFTPVLNHEHLGYAWIDEGTWPRPMHPGLWSTVNIEAVQNKILRVEQDLACDRSSL